MSEETRNIAIRLCAAKWSGGDPINSGEIVDAITAHVKSEVAASWGMPPHSPVVGSQPEAKDGAKDPKFGPYCHDCGCGMGGHRIAHHGAPITCPSASRKPEEPSAKGLPLRTKPKPKPPFDTRKGLK